MAINEQINIDIKPFLDGLNKLAAAAKKVSGDVQSLLSKSGAIKLNVEADSKDLDKIEKQIENISKNNKLNLEIETKGGGKDLFGGLSSQLGGLKEQFNSAKESATAGGGIFGNLAAKAGELASPVGLATAAVGALTTGLAASFTIGQEFETNLKSVSAVTGVTGAALEDIGERAKNLAAQFGGTASDQLGVFQVTLSKIGPQLADNAGALSTFAENVNVLSKTDSALGAAGAVDALTGAMLQFGVNVNDSNEVARESTRFINVLAASAAVGSASVSDVAGAVAVVGGTAKNANVTFEETNAALQVLASKSLVGSQAGTALTAVINKLQAASGPAAEQLKKMGTSSEELGQILTTQGIGAAMDKLRGAVNTLGGTAEKNAFLVGLFGETGLNAAAALLSGGDKLKEYTEGVTGTQSAFEQAAINMNTFSERISRVQAFLSNLAVDIYQAIIPIVNNVISVFSDLFDSIKPVLSDILSNVVSTFKSLGSTLLPVIKVIGGIIGGGLLVAIQSFVTILSGVTTFISRFAENVKNTVAPIFENIGKLFGGLEGNAISLSDVFAVFGKSVQIFTDIASELGLIIADFVVVPFQILYGVINNIVEFFVKFVGSSKDAGKESKNLGKETEKNVGFFTKLGEIILKIPEFLSGLRGAFNAFKQVLFDIGEAITNVFENGIGGTFEKLKNIFSNAGENIADGFNKGVGSKIFKGLNEEIGKFEINAPKLKDDELQKSFNDAIKRLNDLARNNQITDEEFNKAAKRINDAYTRELEFRELSKGATNQQAAAAKAKAKTDEELLKKLSEQFAREKEITDVKNAQNKVSLESLRISQGQTLSQEDKNDLAKKELENAENLVKKYSEIFKIVRDETSGEIKVGVGITADEKTKVKKDFFTLIQDVNAKKISLGVVVEAPKDFKKQIDDIASEFTGQLNVELIVSTKKAQLIEQRDKVIRDLAAFKFQLQNELLFAIDEDSIKAINDSIADIDQRIKTLSGQDITLQISPDFTLDEAKKAKDKFLAALNEQENQINAKLAITTDEKEKNVLKGLIEQINKVRIDGDKNYRAFVDKYNEDKFNAELALIEDASERELAIKIRDLIKKRDKELENTLLTEEAKKKIILRYNDEIAKLTGSESVDFSKSLSNAFKIIAKGLIKTSKGATDEQKQQYEDAKKNLDEVNKKHQERIDKINDELSAIRETNKSGGVLYNKNAEKILQLEDEKKNAVLEANKEIEEANKRLEESSVSAAKLIKKSFAKSFQEVAELSQAQSNKAAESIANSFLKLKTDASGNLTNLTEVSGEAMNQLGQLATSTLMTITAGFGQLVAQGKANFGDFAKVAATAVLDSVQVMVNAYAAGIFGANAQALPFGLGVPAALGLIATLNGLLAVAKGSLSQIGAEDGVININKGYNKKKGITDTIPLWVAPNESIINAKSSIKYSNLLKAINGDGGSIVDGVLKSLNTKEIAALKNQLGSNTIQLNAERNIVQLPINTRQSNDDKQYQKLEKLLSNLNVKIDRNERTEISGKFDISGNNLTTIVNKIQKRKTRGF